jgi:hypothetical protein
LFLCQPLAPSAFLQSLPQPNPDVSHARASQLDYGKPTREINPLSGVVSSR